MYLEKELCLFKIEVDSQKELFKIMSNKLLQSGCVKADFLDGIINREQEYPTALQVGNVGFAIPHTDSSYVNHSQICFASLKNPIIFYDMTDKSRQIEVELVFMLAMEKPHEQIDTLQNLIGLFQDKEKIEQLLICNNKEAFINLAHSAGVY